MKSLTTEFLHELFEYKDGVLYNKVDRHTSKAGERSGFVRKNGYWQVKIGRSNHYAHRIIYQMHHGESPEIIDHIDGDASNNMPDNFRLVCPNCDSQLPTFKARNTGNGRATKGMEWCSRL